MSAKYDSARKRVSEAFHERTGHKPYSPEFVDSLIATMRDKGSCMSERVWAWNRWRGWNNSSEEPVSDWDPKKKAWRLDQLDCCLDLWWFEQGKTAEYVGGAPREYRNQERQRPEVRSMKSAVNQGFLKVEARGQIDIQGHRIYLKVSPQVVDSSSKIRGSKIFETDQAFLEWWKIHGSKNFEKWRSARSTYFAARKVGRSAYRQWLKSRNFAAPVLIKEQSLKNGSEKRSAVPPQPDPPSSSSIPNSGATTTTSRSTPSVSDTESVAPVLEAFETKGCRIDAPRARQLVQECRKHSQDVTISEVAGIAAEVMIGPKLKTPTGFLLKAVENGCDPESLKRYRARQAEHAAAAEAREAEIDRNLQQYEYEDWRDEQVRQKLAEEYPESDKLEAAIKQQVKVLKGKDPAWFGNLPESTRRQRALDQIRQWVCERMDLPSFDKWLARKGGMVKSAASR